MWMANRGSDRGFRAGLYGLALFLVLLGLSPEAGAESGYIRKARVIETARFGIPNPAGLAFLPGSNTFLLLSAHPEAGRGMLSLIQSTRQWAGSVRLKGLFADPVNMVFNAKERSLYLLEAGNGKLIEFRVGTDGHPESMPVRRFDIGRFGLQDPRGMAVDPVSGRLFVLDAGLLWIVRVEPDPAQGAHALGSGWVSYIDLAAIAGTEPRGIAFNPVDGHLYVLSPAAKRLYELTEAGEVLAIRDLSSLELLDPQGMVFAPSGDQTDDPSTMSLYVADAGLDAKPLSTRQDLGTGGIIELSLSPPAQLSGSALHLGEHCYGSPGSHHENLQFLSSQPRSFGHRLPARFGYASDRRFGGQ